MTLTPLFFKISGFAIEPMWPVKPGVDAMYERHPAPPLVGTLDGMV